MSSSALTHIRSQWQTLEGTGFQCKQAWEQLGVDPSDQSARDLLASTAKKIQGMKPWYDYDSQMLVYGDKAHPTAYFKIGAHRAHVEPALRKVAKALDLEDTINPTAPWALEPHEWESQIQIEKLREIQDNYHGQKKVLLSDCVIFCEETFSGTQVDHLPALKKEIVRKHQSVSFQGPLIGVLSPFVEEVKKPSSQQTFLEFVLSVSALGIRDMNPDALVWNQRNFSLIDGEECFACDPSAQTPHLDLTYFASFKDHANTPISKATHHALLQRVNKWNVSKVEKVARSLKILFRNKELERLKPSDEGATYRIQDPKRQFRVYPTEREQIFFPNRTAKNSRLLSTRQIESLKVRIERIKDLLMRPPASSSPPRLSSSMDLNAWTIAFAADPALLRRFAGALEARKALLSSPSEHKDLRSTFRHLRLDSTDEEHFLAMMAQEGGNPASPFPDPDYQNYDPKEINCFGF